MLDDLPGRTLWLALAALCPAALIWWRGRALARHLDDPALPERLFAAGRRGGSILGIACGLLVVASPAAIDWTLPLLIAGHVTAAYPLRKALYTETWTLGGYLSFIARLALGIWGFWLALGLMPFYLPRAGRYDWLAAGIAAAVLLVWNARYVDIFRWLARSRPLQNAALGARFRAVAERSGIPVPRFEWAPLGGGAIANAIALPGSRRSAVLFTDTFLAHMDADEATAVCAHEIAHLEHHTPRLLRRLNTVNITLVAGAALAGVLPRRAGLESSLLPSVLWMVVLVGVAMWRARDRQKHETTSDLRAVALCGDGEALVRALSKLHTFARMPRRMGAEAERHATHPSLARRIRDIRAAAGHAPAALGAASTFTATDDRVTVTFDADRLHWHEGDVASHSLNYSEFSELRLQVSAAGAPALAAVERGGRRWQIALTPTDVTRLQAVLDVVDGRLGTPQPAPAAFARLGRVSAGFAAGIALALGQFALAMVAVIALLQPSAALLAGAGAAALCTALVIFRTYAAAGFDTCAGLASFFATLALALFAAAYSRLRDDPPRSVLIAVAVVGTFTVLWSALLMWNGFSPIHLHLSARSTPAAAVFLFASSAMLACMRTRGKRWLAAPLAVAGVAVLAMGSAWFLDRFGRDPFLEPAQPFTWKTISGALQGEIGAPFYASNVRLSPAGRAVIVEAYADREEDITPRLHVGRPGGRLRPVDAEELVFLDDDRVLGVFRGSSDEAEVREVTVDTPDRVVWRQRVRATWSSSLAYAPPTRTWRLRGMALDGALVQIEGTLGSGALAERRWAALGRGALPLVTAVSGPAALVVETEYLPSVLQRTGWWQLAFLVPGGSVHSRFSRMTGDVRTEVTVTRLPSYCLSASIERDRLLCSAFDGTRTRFAAVDPETAHVTPMGWLPGHVTGLAMSSTGWFSGWTNAEAVAIHPATRAVIRIATGQERLTQLAATDGVVAAVSFAPDGSTIRIYAVDGAAQLNVRAKP